MSSFCLLVCMCRQSLVTSPLPHICWSLTVAFFCGNIMAEGLITCMVQVQASSPKHSFHLQLCSHCLHHVVLQPAVPAWMYAGSIKQRCPAEGGQDISHPVSIKLETLTRSMNGNLAQLHDRGRGNSGGPSDAPRHSQAPHLQPPSYLQHVSSGHC